MLSERGRVLEVDWRRVYWLERLKERRQDRGER